MDAFQIEIRERLTRIEARLEERCSSCFARIEAVEKSVIRSGERIGGLEAQGQRRKGGMAAMSAMAAAAGSLGAVLAKIWPGGQ